MPPTLEYFQPYRGTYSTKSGTMCTVRILALATLAVHTGLHFVVEMHHAHTFFLSFRSAGSVRAWSLTKRKSLPHSNLVLRCKLTRVKHSTCVMWHMGKPLWKVVCGALRINFELQQSVNPASTLELSHTGQQEKDVEFCFLRGS